MKNQDKPHIFYYNQLYHQVYLSNIYPDQGENNNGFIMYRDMNYHPGMYAIDCPFKLGKVVIKDGAHIGIGAIIMPGVTIGEGAVIGAHSVVTHDVPPYCVAVGAPAKVIRTFTDNKEAGDNNK